MKAAILALGSELLGPQRLDTNSLALTAALERHGVELIEKVVLGDDEERIARELRRLAAEADLVITSGGLGPTADDVTRAAVARAFGRSITVDESLVERMRKLFRSFGREMPEVNRRQAEVLEGAEIIPNSHGTAPGQRLEVTSDSLGADPSGAGSHAATHVATLFLFPAVPREMKGLIESCLLPWLEENADPGVGLERTVLKIASRPESEVEERITPAYEAFGRENISVLASAGEIQIHLAARGNAEERGARLQAMRDRLHELVGNMIFTTDAEESLEARVGSLLDAAGETLVTAESCTGGLLGERLTRVPGSSRYYLGGVVSYTNELKRMLLGVPPGELESFGAVSEPVARSMAAGVRQRLEADWGIGITGIAGPGGGSDEKPVGTVHVALAGPASVDHRRVRLPGDRERIRWQASQLALEMLRRRLLGVL